MISPRPLLAASSRADPSPTRAADKSFSSKMALPEVIYRDRVIDLDDDYRVKQGLTFGTLLICT